jgi:hypothetical protein
MSAVMSDDASEVSDLLQRAAAGDEQAIQELFTRYRDRLKRMVHLRLSRRLQGRVDNFKKYETGAPSEVRAAAPSIGTVT